MKFFDFYKKGDRGGRRETTHGEFDGIASGLSLQHQKMSAESFPRKGDKPSDERETSDLEDRRKGP